MENSRNKALQKINEELICLYWNVGKYLNERKQTINYGDKYFADLSAYIKSIYPNLKGFTRRGLYRMLQFYNAYFLILKKCQHC
ncbi:MAG: hypothetical protein K2J93_07695 [Anaeroplasmataceae bacterium]|nr:hypothetical protein [Anaeroplasmataceae bacterium]